MQGRDTVKFQFPIYVDLYGDFYRINKDFPSDRRFTNFGIFDGMADRLAILSPQLRRNFRYLYDYGYALHKECRYEESNVILRERAR